jgi:hypothetical protein
VVSALADHSSRVRRLRGFVNTSARHIPGWRTGVRVPGARIIRTMRCRVHGIQTVLRCGEQGRPSPSGVEQLGRKVE